MLFTYPTWDDIRISGSSARQQGLSAPDFDVFTGGIYQLMFPAASKKDVFFNVQLPHGYQEGSAMSPHMHLSFSTAGVGRVDMEFEYEFASIDGYFNGGPTHTDPKSYTIAGGGEQYHHAILEFDEIPGLMTPGMPRLISCMMVARLSRRGDTDTYPGKVVFLEFDLHFLRDTIGSQGEYQKWASP
jgi:hypothetical protein